MKTLVWLLMFAVVFAGVAGCGKPTKKVQMPVTNPQPVPAVPKIGDVKINPKDGAEMILIPAGDFLMGSTDADKEAFGPEKPQHKVYQYSYYIYKYEVTVAQYRRFCSQTGRPMPDAPPWGWKDDHPMVNVTWEDASAYAAWAGASLPTEAQWEKAARGTDGQEYPWGNEWDAQKCVNNASSTQPVGSYLAGASPYGCMDMAGNAWEWCADWYAEDYYKSAPARNPMGPSKGIARVLRGGSGGSFSGRHFRCADRGYSPAYRYRGLGFRCARTP